MDTTQITYPYLPENKKILYASISDPFMAKAKEIRDTKSGDKNHSTGAVVVKNGIILGEAANQAGYKHEFLKLWHQKWMCFRKWFKISSGQKYWLCPGCATNKNHAETLSINDAILKHGKEALIGADLYLYGHWWCCKPCWDSIINAEVKNVYLLDESMKLFKK